MFRELNVLVISAQAIRSYFQMPGQGAAVVKTILIKDVDHHLGYTSASLLQDPCCFSGTDVSPDSMSTVRILHAM